MNTLPVIKPSGETSIEAAAAKAAGQAAAAGNIATLHYQGVILPVLPGTTPETIVSRFNRTNATRACRQQRV